MAVSKSTKKFQKHHLKRTIDQRRTEQKYKKSISAGSSKGPKGQRGAAPDVDEPEDENEITATKAKYNDRPDYDGMNMEEFLNGGFELPKARSTKGNAKSGKSKEGELNRSEKIHTHQNDLEKLKESDPAFYKYLQENDSELLDFNPELEEDEEDGDEDDEEEYEDEEDTKQSRKSSKSEDLSLDKIKDWKRALDKDKSLNTLKRVLQAFRAAVSTEDTSDEDNNKFRVTDPKVFSALLVLTLKSTPEVLNYHFPLDKKTGHLRENSNFHKIAVTLKHHATSLASVISDKQYSLDSFQLVLTSAQKTLPYLIPFKKAIKSVITAVVKNVARLDSDETVMASFALLRHAAEQYKDSLLEPLLKYSYEALVKDFRRTNIHTMARLNLQKNLTAATLYDLDARISYNTAFTYVRQLAVHLRNSVVNKTAESFKTVYNWQYVHSLDFWSRVICSTCTSTNKEVASSMRNLVHPLVQVTIGTIRLVPTAEFFPLRFYLIRSLIRLSQRTGFYIPLLPLLTETLTSTSITKPPKHSTLKPINFDYTLRVSKTYLGTRVFQDGISEQLVDLLAEFLVLHCKSVAFPELSVPATIQIRRFIKKSKAIKLNKMLQRLVETVESNAKVVEQERSNVDFGPADKAAISAFMKDRDWQSTPLGAYVVVQRQIAEEKRQLLLDSLADEDDQEEVDEDGLEALKDVLESDDEEDADEDDEDDADESDE